MTAHLTATYSAKLGELGAAADWSAVEGTGNFSALVALRAKQGEFTALAKWSRRDQIRSVQPLLVLEPGPSPEGQLGQAADVARKLHAHDRRLMIDAADVADLPAFGGGPAGALGELADRLDGPGDLLDPYPVPFEPVIRTTASPQQVDVWQSLCEELGLGGAIRMRPEDGVERELNRLLERVRLPGAELDLILDLQYVGDFNARITDQAGEQLRAVGRAGPFRSLTLLSGSVPRSLNKTATWEQSRAEEELWQRMIAETDHDLRLGDYGVVHPTANNGRRKSTHVSLKYSCNGNWMYSRESAEGPAEETSEESARGATLRGICQNLAHSACFAGRRYSWGDEEISAAEFDRTRKWGSSSRPVALGTSHHLAYLAERTA